jgi:hypothetical protein
MQRRKSPRQAQDFLSAHAFIHGHFHPRRHPIPASTYHEIRSKAFRVWRRRRASSTLRDRRGICARRFDSARRINVTMPTRMSSTHDNGGDYPLSALGWLWALPGLGAARKGLHFASATLL